MPRQLKALALCLVFSFLASTQAQAADKKIVIGQTTALTGAPALSVAESSIGAALVINAVNKAGGVRGKQIELITLDDAFTPETSAKNAETLLSEHRAIALFLSRGTPTVDAVTPVLAKHQAPLIAPSTGAIHLHNPAINPYVFNLRSSYQAEARRTIEQLAAMTFTRLGVIHVKDSFGTDAMVGITNGFKAVGLEPVVVASYDRKTGDVSDAVKKILDAPGLQAVVIIGSNQHVIVAMKSIRLAGNRSTRLVTISSNASQGFVKGLGADAPGVMVSQVFPSEGRLAMPLVRDTAKLLAARGKGERLTPAMLEGAAAARLLVEALKKTPDPITSKALMATLESGTPFNIGWPHFEVRYSPTDHTGVKNYSDISIISNDGRFVR